ncbi:unnamed protein product [Adineta ricciae]|uniref:Beta-lactamase-related domain-containing protein n=1 Tax=Adineta ricciae TaxID=249248 RepID=A0A814ACI7_ADIRI|nr:unnamed protein product [Adineta ricciae]
MRTVLLLSITILAQAYLTTAECPPTKGSIQNLLDEVNVPGAAIIVLNRDGILYEQAFGYHTPPISDSRRPIDTSQSIFMIASISKTFISVAAMQMVESNLLNLDTDINEYLSPLMKIIHPYHPNVTITTRHLLTHTAGIGPNWEEESKHYLSGDRFTQTNLGNVLNDYLSRKKGWLSIPPGNITLYSNVGTSLAAFIVERVSGMSYEQYVLEKILKPLGLNDKKASFRLKNFEDNKENLVDHYVHNASFLETFQQMGPQMNITQAGSSDWLYIPFFGLSIYPAGALHMSAHSLSIFFRSFLNNFPNLLRNSSTMNEMLYIFPQQDYMNISTTKFSLIWHWPLFEGRRLVGHDGSVPGITTSMMANEKRDLGVVILTNGDVTRSDSEAMQLRQTIRKLTTQMLDCYETNKSLATNQQCNIIYISWMLSILCFYTFCSSTQL